MKLLKLCVIALNLFILPIYAQTVQFNIEAVKHDTGKLYVQLFKGEDNYKKGKAYNAAIVRAKAGDVMVTFNDVEPGEYAIRFFHDENDNGSLDTNMFSIPVEGYGFSNNAVINFGPPSYREMAFNVAEAPVSNSSKVNY
ncbi:hypothetical protein AN214_00014 [Pseudoalteromonas sp. P1-9]|uniref:DUF2141 domain-containing protein n=1 Tax=Pseudoalteromonas sp. P1-9 TaxID=1710354 RepID=UPI0006D607CE|nr:DUF2141 domain-containing protein [Pseudoalteromonas sp. P1-9]KPV98253.1 hypothetical protein AN214_00014 [Pseudoalteromonas sp. P1-9]